MRRWETLVLLAAVTCASLATVPIGRHRHFGLAFIAIALVAVLGLLRMRRFLTQLPNRVNEKPTAYERARRIHRQREGRYHR